MANTWADGSPRSGVAEQANQQREEKDRRVAKAKSKLKDSTSKKMPKTELGKSAGQKAVDKNYNTLKDGIDDYGPVDDMGGFGSPKSGIVDALNYKASPLAKEDAKKANKEAASKLKKDADEGRKKAEKALGKKIPHDNEVERIKKLKAYVDGDLDSLE